MATLGQVGSVVGRIVALAALVAVATAATYAKGIDVSNYQGSSIDWLQVSSNGYTFAFAKATESTTFTDVTYAINRSGTSGVGMRLGAYHFAQPSGATAAAQTASAIAQADHFVDVAQPRGGDLPPALDLEVTNGLKPPALVTWTQAWLNEVAARTGANALIYASPSFWKTNLSDTTAFALASHRLWVAHWTKSAAPTIPASNWGGTGWTFWQWSDCQPVPGIPSKCVDADRANGPSPVPFALPAMPGGAPASATQPSIVGTIRAGQKLAAVPGTWNGGKPIAFTYQWLSCTSTTGCAPIPGATLETYTPGASDIGRQLEVSVTANAKTGSATAASPPTTPVAAANGVAVPVATQLPLLSGTVQVGQTLTATPGTWNGNPYAYAYTWQRCDPTGAACQPIPGATASTYTPTPGDAGSTLSLEVTATNSAGSQTATAATTVPVALAPVPPAVAGSLAAVAGQAGAVVTTDGTATVTWQPGAVPVGTTVSLATSGATLQLALAPAASLLPWPVDVAYAAAPANQVVGFSTDGKVWSPVAALLSPTLPVGVNVGAYTTGGVQHLLTRRAGDFQLFVPNSFGDPTKVSRYAPRLRRIAPIRVRRLRSGALVVSTRMTTPSQILVLPTRRRILAPGSFPVRLRVSGRTRHVTIVGIDPYGRRGSFTLSFRSP